VHGIKREAREFQDHASGRWVQAKTKKVEDRLDRRTMA